MSKKIAAAISLAILLPLTALVALESRNPQGMMGHRAEFSLFGRKNRYGPKKTEYHSA